MAERLTKRCPTHIAVICGDCKKHGDCYDSADCAEVLRERLAAYEDLGTVEELAALKENAGCGCGICLVHNDMKCPKVPKEAANG